MRHYAMPRRGVVDYRRYRRKIRLITMSVVRHAIAALRRAAKMPALLIRAAAIDLIHAMPVYAMRLICCAFDIFMRRAKGMYFVDAACWR